MKDVSDCQNIREIRAAIDEIDHLILVSLAKRHKYVKAVVKFKTDQAGIIDRERQLEVLQKRKEWAMELGLDPELIVSIYETLIDWNVNKELEIFRNKETPNS
ncbi:MAG TPA: chorismate mutase [Prolixibacteraceae bacterium]|nr:chorismate mutase [Prolixibacteraceae bacterium]